MTETCHAEVSMEGGSFARRSGPNRGKSNEQVRWVERGANGICDEKKYPCARNNRGSPVEKYPKTSEMPVGKGGHSLREIRRN